MYLWIVIVGGAFAFFAAAGIGSNDAANAFATSVGSKALTLKQAVVLAAIFETSGAVLMGSHVTNTIRKGIADYKCFEDDAYLLMYGCMWVILAVGIWLFLASYLEMPVSTTHSCVGGMIGMALATGGSDCVVWYKIKNEFPYVGGVILERVLHRFDGSADDRIQDARVAARGRGEADVRAIRVGTINPRISAKQHEFVGQVLVG